jgi:hypothetical protein
VIEQDGTQHAASTSHPRCHGDILPRGLWIAAWMIVCKHHGTGAKSHGRAKDLARIDHGEAITAPGEHSMRQGTAPTVEVQRMQLLV